MKTCPECYSEYEDSFKTCPTDSSPLKTIEKDPLVGTTLANRYLIESVVGKGGMGVVYKARNQVMDKPMAIKMLHSHLVAEPEAVKRFHREAKTVSQVRHHHIITLYDFGMSAQRQPYLVMDFLEGTSLKSVMKEAGPVPFERVERIYQQVIEALGTAHSLDLVHRDLKPENIMLSHFNNEEDWVTIVDFGLSKLKDVRPMEDSYQITKVGDVCGSPPYMSPEQCLSSQVVDPRSDIYSLGICIYETLCGKLPFNAKSAIEMLDSHLYATPTPFSQTLSEFKVCTELTKLFNKALQKEADKRHQTIEEFGREFIDAIKRDGLKLKAYKHRLQTSEFSDLASEAEALSRQMESLRSGGNGIITAPETTSLDGVQFVKDEVKSHSAEHKVRKRRTDRRLLETTGGPIGAVLRMCGLMPKNDAPKLKKGWTVCPYCDTPAEPGIRFCMNCKHQFLSAQEMSKLKKVQAAVEASGDMPAYSAKGFSSKAKGLTAGKGAAAAIMQKVLMIVVVLGLSFLAYIGFTNQDVQDSISKVFNGVPLKEPPKTAPANAAAGTRHDTARTARTSSRDTGAGGKNSNK